MLRDLPQDPVILLSYINTKLRDNYRSLDELCEDLDVDRRDLESRLATISYVYSPQQNKFI